MNPDGPPRGLRTDHAALLRYAVVWIALGVSAAALALAVVHDTHVKPRDRAGDPLGAVVASGCVLERARGRQARVAVPPVSGPAGRATAEGIYATPQPKRRLVGALRQGVVVVQYRPQLASSSIAALRSAFSTADPRRIVVPDATGMTFAVAATAWGRVLGCSKVNSRVVVALRTFAARYSDSGPRG